jgi:HEAT repeat protein
MAGSIDRFLDRALKIRAGEGSKVGFMALYAANAIGAVVVGRTVRDTLFLGDGSHTKNDLPLMYIVNSIAVALMSWAYARVADGVRRDRLNAMVASVWAVVMLGFFGAASIFPKSTAPVLYVAVEAMGSLVVIQFWTFAQDVFTSREAKRLFPLISAGGQAANVIYGFLASSLSKTVSAESLLVLCALNLVACAILAVYIAKRFGGASAPSTPRGRQVDRSSTASKGFKALATPHLVTIALIGVISAVAVNLVDYEFKAAAESQFSVDKKAMGAYFGKFYGICGALALALQMGLTGRILERFGILASLLPLPVGLMLGSTFAWLFPSGWTTSLAKGSDSIFRYTLNDASMQLLYVPVPTHQRGRAKALIDGMLKPLAGVVAGLMLVMLGHGPKQFQRHPAPAPVVAQKEAAPAEQTPEGAAVEGATDSVEEDDSAPGTNALAVPPPQPAVQGSPVPAPVVKKNHMPKAFRSAGEAVKRAHEAALAAGRVAPPDGITTTLILLLGGGWVILLWRGRREYVASLLETLQKRRLDLQSAPMNADQATADAIARILKSNDALQILNALELLQHVQGHDFGPLVAELLDHRISSVRAAAADHLAAHADGRYAEKVRERLNDGDPWCVASAIGAICALEKEKALPLVKPFLKDPRPAIRAAAVVGLVRNCGINGILEAADELKRQLNAPSTVERELAASVLGALSVPTFYDALLRFLDDPSPNVRRAAMNAAGRLKSPELIAPLVRLLGRRDSARDAAKALVAFGSGVESTLGRALHDESFTLDVRRAIPAVLGRIGTKEAADVLQSTLSTQDPPMRAAAARGLARLMRRRTDIVVRREEIMKAVGFEISHAEHLGDIQVALALPTVDRTAPLQLGRGRGSGALLALALVEERDRSVQRAIVLLELLHPNAGLDLVADNLRSDSPARRANAVEVLDNTVQEDLKKRLLQLVEDRMMRPPPPVRTPDKWLAELLTGPHAWIAACAAQVALERQVQGLATPLQQGLTSPVPYLREACATALARLSPAEARTLLVPLKQDPARSVRRFAEFFLTPLPASA